MGRLEPRSNRGFIAFNGFALGFLRTEAEFAHQFTNMIRVEVNACDALADIRDALSCPAIHGEPPVQRPEFRGVEQLLLILSADALPGSRVGFSSQGCATTSKPSSVPFADGCAADLEFESDPFLVEFIRCEEFSALEAAFFELRFGQSSWFPCHGGMILEFITLKMPTSVIKPEPTPESVHHQGSLVGNPCHDSNAKLETVDGVMEGSFITLRLEAEPVLESFIFEMFTRTFSSFAARNDAARNDFNGRTRASRG